MQLKPRAVLAIFPYPINTAPGQRFRFEQYLSVLEANNYNITMAPFLDSQTMRVLYQKGSHFRKLLGVLRGFLRRSALMFTVRKYDMVFLYLAASPIGPPIFEFILFKMGIRVIYDFDDAIFLRNPSQANKIASLVKCSRKVSYICRRADCVSVSVPFLAQWAKSLNENVRLVPTSVDLQYHNPSARKFRVRSDRLCIGWTGSHSTVKYLDRVRPVLATLSHQFDFDFVVICDVDPDFRSLANYRYIKWRLETEIFDLSHIDIGIMPSPAGEWEMGKAGFKAIQYSALGIVPVVSANGSGNAVVAHGKTGYCVSDVESEWVAALSELLNDAQKRIEMGNEARKYVAARYSVQANTHLFLSLFSDR